MGGAKLKKLKTQFDFAKDAFGQPQLFPSGKSWHYHDDFLNDVAFGDHNNKTASNASTLSAAEEPAAGEKVLGLSSIDAGANTEYGLVWLDTHRSNFDEGVFWAEWMLKVDTIGVTTNSIKVFVGMGNVANAAADVVIGHGFLYDHASNGAVWTAFTGNNAAGTTNIVLDGLSGRGSAPIVADTYMKLGMKIDLLNSSVKYYFNGVQVDEITTTLPTDNTNDDTAIIILKVYSDSASTSTTRKAVLDYFDLRCVWTSPEGA